MKTFSRRALEFIESDAPEARYSLPLRIAIIVSLGVLAWAAVLGFVLLAFNIARFAGLQ